MEKILATRKKANLDTNIGIDNETIIPEKQLTCTNLLENSELHPDCCTCGKDATRNHLPQTLPVLTRNA